MRTGDGSVSFCRRSCGFSDTLMARRGRRDFGNEAMIRTIVHALSVVALLWTVQAEAQTRPPQPNRPPWQDVCCGGPCCKPRPGR